MAKGGYVYIMSNKSRSVVYVGSTDNLYNRAYQHKNGFGSEFTKKYNCTDLIYYQFYERIEIAREREHKIKKWNRAWKDKLIRDFNPTLKDLFEEVSDLQ
ncbi:GIY-YIG nuclease family protein [Ekhidna sp.]|uniref:GIY-YIG nuclease family protein n=1 Tax=Ekhidna sp. TaxID=2608089 RepID=UPI003299C6A9